MIRYFLIAVAAIVLSTIDRRMWRRLAFGLKLYHNRSSKMMASYIYLCIHTESEFRRDIEQKMMMMMNLPKTTLPLIDGGQPSNLSRLHFVSRPKMNDEEGQAGSVLLLFYSWPSAKFLFRIHTSDKIQRYSIGIIIHTTRIRTHTLTNI